MRFSKATATKLGHYVYALVDPRNEEIFYVGKASANNRAFNHLRTAPGEGAKQQRIQEIRATGAEPVIEVLRYGLESARHCFEVEAAVIDALGFENLTNKVRGHGIERGRLTAAEVQLLLGSKEVEVTTQKSPLMLIFINRTYSPTLNEQEIYDCTRQFWYQVSKSKRAPNQEGKLPYPVALAVVDSVVVRAYSVVAWFPAGTTLSSRESDEAANQNRWEFVGNLLKDHPLVGKKLVKSGSNLPANEKGYGYIN